MKIEPINTKVGVIKGRDGIYLHKMEYNGSEIIFYGELVENLFNNFGGKDLKYKLTFRNIVFYKCYELDIYPMENLLQSSFDLIKDSELLKKLKSRDSQNKIQDNHKHYIFGTYDDIFEIIATEYDLIIDNEINVK